MSRRLIHDRRWPRHIAVAVVLIAVAASATLACGPYFEHRLLREDEQALFQAPAGAFPREVDRIRSDASVPWQAVLPEGRTGPYQQTIDVDTRELTEALASTDLPPGAQRELADSYRVLRAALSTHAKDAADQRERSGADAHREATRRPFEDASRADLLDQLPTEFALYVRGAIAWAEGDSVAARARWRRLLELPASQRTYRSTWAAYMIGRSYVDDDPAKAGAWFKRTREFARSRDFADALGLAAASLGWEARAALELERYEQAITLYLSQLTTGDDSAYASLHACVRRVLNSDPEVQKRVARHAASRRVVTAWLVSQSMDPWINGGQTRSAAQEQWLAVIENAGIEGVTDADRLAWLAYHAGQMDSAARWLARADPGEPMTLWLKARLALRAGDVDRAMPLLAAASRAFPGATRGNESSDPSRRHRFHTPQPLATAARVRGELAILNLSRGQYVEALDLLLRSDYWIDAAYIAERVLSADELKGYVDTHWAKPEQDDEHNEDIDAAVRRRICHLLARRLTRIGRWREARRYFPARLQPALDAYITGIRRGHDAALKGPERADAFWHAARIARHQGIDLLGTELGPDWRAYGGSFMLGHAADEAEARPAGGGMAAGDDEARRLNDSMPAIDQRWHYRYTAAEHAWSALAMMPDHDPTTAERFVIAGRWLAANDPDAADRFYKALVNRCGQTDLGRQADELRWFPEISEPVYRSPDHGRGPQ